MNSLRDLFARITDGDAKHEIRQFNLAIASGGQLPSVVGLCEKLGLKVVLHNLPDGASGYLEQSFDTASNWRIVVNGKHSIVRRRWTVLHELGHYLLHQDRSDFFALESHRSSDNFYLEHETLEENEANQFAAVVVFGDGALAAGLARNGYDQGNTARKLGVSVSALRNGKRDFG